MNFILDIIIPRNEINKLNIEEEMIEWGEEKLSQDPPKYKYKSVITLHESTDSFYQDSIEKFDAQNHIILTLEHQQLSELELLVNSHEKEISDNILLVFMTELYTMLDWFYIYMYRDEECIDNKYLITDASNLHKIICDALRWSSPEGVVIVKK